ncbi:MAG: GNAT family N-acetyltransferase [Planctomycetota bacterium]
MPRPTILQTERLRLRPFQPGDVEDARAYRNDPEFVRFLPHIPFPFTREHAEAFVATNQAEPWATSPIFAVEFEERVIGNLNFEVQIESSSVMLGYAIGRDWWGQGLATEAAQAAMTWAAEAFTLRRVWASTDVRNVRSRRVLEKLGMRQERILEADHLGRDGSLIDEVVYALKVDASPSRSADGSYDS